jgi:hypothetical protein
LGAAFFSHCGDGGEGGEVFARDAFDRQPAAGGFAA